MAAKKHTPPPRPGKNSDGQAKQPSNPPAPPAPQGAPGVNPMTHSSAPGVQPLAPQESPTDPSGGAIQKQSRQSIGFKDMPPPMQMQAEAQQGMDPMAPLKMLQSNVANTVGQGESQGPVPNMLTGPGVPDGLENFPSDLAHLHGLMQQGLGPGASPQEHALGQNAQAIARAHAQQAESNAQQSAQYAQHVQQLGGMMHNLGSQGQLPAPQDVAAHVAAMQVPPPGSVLPPGFELPGFGGATVPGQPGPGPQMPPPGQADMGAPPAGPPQLGSNMTPPPAMPPTTPDGGIPPGILDALRKRAKGGKPQV